MVVAEGARYNAEAMAKHFEENKARLGFELRVTRLGHVQRGGAPGAYDRLLATNLGAGAVEALARGEQGKLVGLVGNQVTTTPYRDIIGVKKPLEPRFFDLARILAK